MMKARHRRLSTYLYLQDLLSGAAVLEVGPPTSEDREALLKLGAKTAEVREPAELPSLGDATFDVVVALDAEPASVVQLPVGELDAAAPDAPARVAELEAECAKLREKEKDSRAEAWKALKSRSEAEAAAAEVREDTVRKLKDARKLASVELMRAMEEATKKNVSLKEEAVRTERARKEFKAEVARLQEELESIKAPPTPLGVARAKEEGDAAVLAVRAQAERSMHDETVARAAAEEA